MKGIGLKDKISHKDREFYIQTGNDPQKNIIRSDVFEKGSYLFHNVEEYKIRENNSESLSTKYLKETTFAQHQKTIDEIKLLFLIYEKIKQIRQYLPHYRLGKVFYARNFIEEAIDNFKRVTELRPDFIRGHQKHGLACLKAGKYDSALKSLLDAYKLAPEYPDITNAIAVTYTALGNYKQATMFIKKTIACKPGFVEANFNLGVIIFLSSIADEEDDEKVVIPVRFMRSFKELIRQESYDTPEWAEIFERTQDVLDEANKKKVFEQILSLQQRVVCNDDGSDIMDFFFLQFMYGGKELGHTQLAIYEDRINNEVEGHSDYADYWNELGVIHLVQCREYFIKALSEFEKARKADASFEAASRNAELMRRGKNGFLILLRAVLK